MLEQMRIEGFRSLNEDIQTIINKSEAVKKAKKEGADQLTPKENVKDFELLVSLGVFNDSLTNDAVYKFKRYEDASLSCTGINRHQGEKASAYDTVVSNADYSNMFSLQQESMEAPELVPIDLPNTSITAQMVCPRPVQPKPTPQMGAAPAPWKKQIDTNGVKVGSVLRHKVFGTGEVTAMEGKYI